MYNKVRKESMAIKHKLKKDICPLLFCARSAHVNEAEPSAKISIEEGRRICNCTSAAD